MEKENDEDGHVNRGGNFLYNLGSIVVVTAVTVFGGLMCLTVGSTITDALKITKNAGDKVFSSIELTLVKFGVLEDQISLHHYSDWLDLDNKIKAEIKKSNDGFEQAKDELKALQYADEFSPFFAGLTISVLNRATLNKFGPIQVEDTGVPSSWLPEENRYAKKAAIEKRIKFCVRKIDSLYSAKADHDWVFDNRHTLEQMAKENKVPASLPDMYAIRNELTRQKFPLLDIDLEMKPFIDIAIDRFYTYECGSPAEAAKYKGRKAMEDIMKQMRAKHNRNAKTALRDSRGKHSQEPVAFAGRR
ncbi:MAG: hypothetical protein WC356_03910 [Candidatus Micrarchaeia archaeon]